MTTAGRADLRAPGPSPAARSGLRWWPFIILAVAAVAALLGGWRAPTAQSPLAMVWVLLLGTGLALAVFLEMIARLMASRQRLAAGFDASPEAARAVLDATAGLTRVVSVALAVFMGLLVAPYTWFPALGGSQALLLAIAVLVAAIVWSVWSLKSVHGRLEAAGQLGGLEGWNGITYSNPNDPRLWVPKLSGVGATLNFAHGRSWLILCGILAVPLMGLLFALLAVLRR